MAVSQTLKLYQGTPNAVANTSPLRILWKSTQSGDSHNNNTRTANYWISVNGGTEQKYSVNYTLPKGKTQTILDTTIPVPHDDLGKCTVKVRTWMDTKISAGVVQKSASIDLTPIPRANTIAAGDAYIGKDMRISVVRKSASYLHTIKYAFGSLTGTIAEKSAASEYDFHIPDNWDMEMTKSKTAPITLTCITYAGDTEIGRSTAKAQIKTDGTFAPQLSWRVIDIAPATTKLTGDPSFIVLGSSLVRATLEVSTKRGATLVWRKINGVETNELLIPKVQSGAFTFSARDSRGWETTERTTLKIVPYIQPSVIVEPVRAAQGSDALALTIKGSFYNGSFGKEDNSLTVQYQVGNGAWQTATPAIDGNTYATTIDLSLNYQTAHKINISVADRLISNNQTVPIPRAIPQTMEGEGWIRHNVPVYQVCPRYNSDTDNDESALEAWLDGLLDDMPNISTMDIAWNCYPAVSGSTAFGKLSKYRDGYAVFHGASYDGKIYLKTKNGTWSATKKAVI